MLHTLILQSQILLSAAVLALGVVLPASAANEASVYNDVSSSASSGAEGEARADAYVRTIINGQEVIDTKKSETGESAAVTVNEIVVVPEYEYQEPQQSVQEQEREMPAGVQNLIPTTSVLSPEESQSINVKVSSEELDESDNQKAESNFLNQVITVAGDVAEKIKGAIQYAVDYLFA